MILKNKLKITGLNINGMRNNTTQTELFKTLKSNHTDILLLQEHNLNLQTISEFIELANDNRYTAYVSISNSPDNRGGTAILVRQCPHITGLSPLADYLNGDSIGGAICIAQFDIKTSEHTLDTIRLASVYAHSQEGIRGPQIEKLTKALEGVEFCQGDWNCVAEPFKDCAYELSEQYLDTSKNKHGPELEKLLYKSNLIDARFLCAASKATSIAVTLDSLKPVIED